MTKSQRIRESAVMISSTMPSTKYSCSGSPLILAKGNTAIDGLSGSGGPGLPSPASRLWRSAPSPAMREWGDPGALAHLPVDQLGAERLEPAKRAFLVGFDQARIAGDIGREDRREPTFDASWPCGLHDASSVARDPTPVSAAH